MLTCFMDDQLMISLGSFKYHIAGFNEKPSVASFYAVYTKEYGYIMAILQAI